MSGESIGRYRIIRPLGEGGMGRVLLAEVEGASGFARRVVLKLVRDELDEGLKQALLDEAKLTATLVHRNIVPVLDLQESGSQRLVVLEHVDGMDLRRLLELARPLPWTLAAFIASEVAAGLDYAHRQKDAAGQPLHLVHRDVSPANILLSWEGEVKLGDFGIAKVARAEARQGPWVTAGLKGNLGYMAPEQAARGAIDPRADIYSLGVVLFEMLGGTRPAMGDAAPPARLPPLPMDAAAPELAALVARATAERADQRFANAAALRESLLHLPGQPADPARQLATFLGQLRARSRLDGDALVEAVLGDKPATRAVRAASGQATRSAWWRRGAALAVALLAAGGLAAAGVRLLGARQPGPAGVAPATSVPNGQGAATRAPNGTGTTTGASGATTSGLAGTSGNAAAVNGAAPGAAPAQPSGPCALAVRAEPAGARIVVDGRPAGHAPATLTLACRAAPYRVALSAPDRTPWERRVTLDAPRTSLNATLLRRGTLSVNAIPWANLFLDGAPLGHTPRLRVPLDAGRHQLRLVTQAGDTRTRSIEITPARDTRVTVSFSEP